MRDAIAHPADAPRGNVRVSCGKDWIIRHDPCCCLARDHQAHDDGTLCTQICEEIFTIDAFSEGNGILRPFEHLAQVIGQPVGLAHTGTA